jgi:hypothetical protein
MKNIWVLGLVAAGCFAQPTQVDYRTQIKNKPFISITDYPYNADPSGAKDSSAAINACIAASASCFLPDQPNGTGGMYKILSPLVLRKANFAFTCASKSTTITYAGGSTADVVVIGNLDGLTNNVVVNNCTVLGNSSVTANAVHIIGTGTVTLSQVFAGSAPTGIRVDNSILTKLDNVSVTGYFGTVTPTYGIVIGGVSGTTVGSNQTLIINPQIQAMTGATGIWNGALGSGTTFGTHIIGGTIEQVGIGWLDDTKASLTKLDSIDIEVTSTDGVQAKGNGLSINGSASVIIATLHVFPSAANTTAMDSNFFQAVVEAGALNTNLMRNAFDPNDQPGLVIASASWAATAGGTATYHTTAAYPLKSGATAVINGITPSGYFNNCKITVVDSTTFTCPLTPNPGAYVSGGAITTPTFLYNYALTTSFSGNIFQPGSVPQEDYVNNVYTGIDYYLTTTKGCVQCIDSGGTGSANNALVATMPFAGVVGQVPVVVNGASYKVLLRYTLSGANTNTLNFLGAIDSSTGLAIGAIPIRSAYNTAGGITAHATTGAYGLTVTYDKSGPFWIVQ